MANLRGIMRFLCLKLIALYQYCISPLLGPCCRFHPSCAQYASEAIRQHGVLYGVYLIIKRLARCHPWGSSGYDPVPEINKQK